MEFNVCLICGANNGRAGMLIGNPEMGLPHACLNCDDTRKTGKITIHTHLIRTDEEIQKTMDILKNNE